MAKKQSIFDKQLEKNNRTVVTKSLNCATCFTIPHGIHFVVLSTNIFKKVLGTVGTRGTVKSTAIAVCILLYRVSIKSSPDYKH